LYAPKEGTNLCEALLQSDVLDCSPEEMADIPPPALDEEAPVSAAVPLDGPALAPEEAMAEIPSGDGEGGVGFGTLATIAVAVGLVGVGGVEANRRHNK
jgi:hypothetical protein